MLAVVATRTGALPLDASSYKCSDFVDLIFEIGRRVDRSSALDEIDLSLNRAADLLPDEALVGVALDWWTVHRHRPH